MIVGVVSDVVLVQVLNVSIDTVHPLDIAQVPEDGRFHRIVVTGMGFSSPQALMIRITRKGAQVTLTAKKKPVIW